MTGNNNLWNKHTGHVLDVLSHDKFIATAISLFKPKCDSCKYKDPSGVRCFAFPEGIPRAIYCNQINHDKPVENDNGIQYEPINPDESSLFES